MAILRRGLNENCIPPYRERAVYAIASTILRGPLNGMRP